MKCTKPILILQVSVLINANVKYKNTKIMGLEQIIQDYNNEIEPRLDEMIKYFESNANTISLSNLQREFGLGYRRATRAKRQLKEIME